MTVSFAAVIVDLQLIKQAEKLFLSLTSILAMSEHDTALYFI